MSLSIVPKTEPVMVAIVRMVNQYGQPVIQPVNSVALEFAQIAGTKTLTRPTIEAMKRLGYTVEVEQNLPKVL